MRLFADTHYDFLGKRRRAYTITGALVALSVVAAIFWQIRAGSWLDYGVEFTGGTLVQVQFTEPTSVAALRDLIGPVLPATDITAFGSENEFLVRTRQFTEAGESASAVIDELLRENFDAGAYQVVRTEAIGPTVGEELQQKAILAILISFGLTLIYLAFRFQWQYGLAAIAAIVHDVVLSLGLISALQIEVTLPIVAALLTIIGYSLNDTIVIFDFARENFKKLGRKVEYTEVLNRSINETLSRTVITAGATFLALLALLVFGVAIIRDFALVLIFGGLISGTYSSIFVASPVLYEVHKRWGSRKDRPKRARRTRAKARV